MMHIKQVVAILSIFAFNVAYADIDKGLTGCNKISKEIEIPSKVKQLLVVNKSESQFYLYACIRKGNVWHENSSLRTKVAVGKNGLAKPGEKIEGDLKTPTGIFPLGTAFGISQQDLDFPYRILTNDDKFIDDIADDNYNSWVNGETTAKSYEPMKRYYRYGIVIKYNMNPVIKGKGSAIFIHNWNYQNEPTSGCIAMPEKKLLNIIKWLQAKKKPSILIE